MKTYLATNRADETYVIIHAASKSAAWKKLKARSIAKRSYSNWSMTCLSGTGVNIRALVS